MNIGLVIWPGKAVVFFVMLILFKVASDLFSASASLSSLFRPSGFFDIIALLSRSMRSLFLGT